ncbi:Zn-ribbon domain-containing OB-fold protein [Desulfatiglans anilini]|uniref:Zn-ribbon domain-containing OB-fold protein n=1 Tax=Desulfatiglans anilini TaxID=90728 RepID=UPI00041BB099|nr:OB-fold domain-containing protein [Desulfatiglans anilini]
MNNRVPVRENLFDELDGGRLHANRCKACGKIYFPQAPFCFDCLEKTMEPVILSRKGKLYSYTIGRMASTHFPPPYAVGLIDLPEGVRVFAPLVMTKDEPYRIGMQMELSIEELWQEEDQHVIGYKFKPLAE